MSWFIVTNAIAGSSGFSRLLKSLPEVFPAIFSEFEDSFGTARMSFLRVDVRPQRGRESVGGVGQAGCAIRFRIRTRL